VGGLFELSLQDSGESTGAIVEIPGIESKRSCALARRFFEQPAVAKNIRHTEVRARTIRAFSEKVAGKIVSPVQFSFLYMGYGGSRCRFDRVGIQGEGPRIALINLVEERLAIGIRAVLRLVVIAGAQCDPNLRMIRIQLCGALQHVDGQSIGA